MLTTEYQWSVIMVTVYIPVNHCHGNFPIPMERYHGIYSILVDQRCHDTCGELQVTTKCQWNVTMVTTRYLLGVIIVTTRHL